MRNAILFLFLFSISIHDTALASDSCSTVRLYRESRALRNNPVSLQQGPNCYVHSASILLSGYIARNLSRRSMIDVEAERLTRTIEDLGQMNIENGVQNANTGRVCNVLQFVRNSCLQNLESLENAPDSNPPRGNVNQAGLAWNVDMIFSRLNPFDRSRMTDIIRACRRDPQIRHLLANLPDCENTDAIKNGDFFELENPETFEQTLHHLFDLPTEQQLPVSVEYCSQVLKSRNYSGIINRSIHLDWNRLNTQESVENLDPQCGFHASAVVGRERLEDGKCYFIIQNSWGRDCEEYDGRCENGRIWVEESDLARNILRITNLNYERF